MGSSWAQHSECWCAWASVHCAHRALQHPWARWVYEETSTAAWPCCLPAGLMQCSCPCHAWPSL